MQELGGTFFGGEALQLLQYADVQKQSRVGVSPDMAGQNKLSEQRVRPRCGADDVGAGDAGQPDGASHRRDRVHALPTR